MAVSIELLTTAFGAVTLAVPAIVAWRFRRRPARWLMARAEANEAEAQAIVAALEAVRAAGSAAEADRLLPALVARRRALDRLVAMREFGRPPKA